MQEINLNTIGAAIVFTIVDQNGAIIDITGATEMKICLKKQSGVTVVKTAELVTNGIAGKIQYKTVAGDLDELGVWEAQARVTLSPTRVYPTKVNYFKVVRNTCVSF